MTLKQKFIKYLAFLLAGFLIASMALAAFGVLSSLLGIEDKRDVVSDYDNSLTVSSDITILKLSVSASQVKIVRGETLVVATDNSEIEITEKGSVLEISEKKKLGVFENDRLVIITVPENKVFESVRISAGAGEINVEALKAEALNMELGAGDIVFDSLEISGRASVNAAAGELIVRSGSINDLEMNLAVGDVNLKAALTGKTEIDCAAGDIDIELAGEEADYSIEVDKGISSCKFNGKELKDDTRYGDGKNIIEIDGGIGDIEITTK